MVAITTMEICPICYDYKKCIPLRCGHFFCKNCIRNTIKHFNTDLNDEFSCPICRSNVTEIRDTKTNRLLKKLYDKIHIRKTSDDIYGTIIWNDILYYYFYIPVIKDIYNYPENIKFYTYEQSI